ncbi:hypothetical protein KM043_002183 [Ampulex compressa]|nr:hypothetical protein KM043_002183 [Ampulex compressa]
MPKIYHGYGYDGETRQARRRRERKRLQKAAFLRGRHGKSTKLEASGALFLSYWPYTTAYVRMLLFDRESASGVPWAESKQRYLPQQGHCAPAAT